MDQVFDMGGGTLDLTFMKITDGYTTECISGGNGRCGGQDIDQLLIEYVYKTYFTSMESSSNDDGIDNEGLLSLCKNAKESLSQESEVTFEYKTQTISITRKVLEHLMLPILDKIKEAVTSLLEKADYFPDEVVLVGGSSRMPVIRRFLRDILKFDEDNKELCTSISPEEAVAEGLAIRGAVLMGYDIGYLQSVLMMDTLPASIGLLLNDDYQTDNHGNIISEGKKVNNTKEDGNGIFHTVIERGTKLPCRGALTFPVDQDALKQKFVTLGIYEDISTEKGKDIVDLKLLANDDFLLPINHHFEAVQIPQKITVEFKVSSEGKLQIMLYMGDKVIEDHDSNNAHLGDKDEMRIWTLYLFLAVTVLLYLFIKLQLQTTFVRDEENIETTF